MSIVLFILLLFLLLIALFFSYLTFLLEATKQIGPPGLPGLPGSNGVIGLPGDEGEQGTVLPSVSVPLVQKAPEPTLCSGFQGIQVFVIETSKLADYPLPNCVAGKYSLFYQYCYNLPKQQVFYGRCTAIRYSPDNKSWSKWYAN